MAWWCHTSFETHAQPINDNIQTKKKNVPSQNQEILKINTNGSPEAPLGEPILLDQIKRLT
jgi:hypothetical protein